MSYNIKNRLNQPITGELADGTALILFPKQSKTIKDSQVNEYVKGLVASKYVTLTEIEEVPTNSEKANKSNKAQKKEGGKDNGNTIET